MGPVVALYEALAGAPDERARARVIAAAFELLEEPYPHLPDLVTKMDRKFGPLSRSVHDRVANADPETLLRWSDRILTADSLAAVLHEMSHVTTNCYYQHESAADEHFTCLDGRSTVCPLCCRESCPSAAPEWFTRCRDCGHRPWPSSMRASAPRKLVCLETYWGDDRPRLSCRTSVGAFLDGLSSLSDPPIALVHRFCDTMSQLAGYTAPADGLLWRAPAFFDTPIYYMAFHDSRGTLHSARDSGDLLGGKSLIDAFANWGQEYPNLVYFGACSLFAGPVGDRFARDFLTASKCRAVIGYGANVDWLESLLIDLLFFHRFYSHPDPWAALLSIHQQVTAYFPRAERLDYRIHLRE